MKRNKKNPKFKTGHITCFTNFLSFKKINYSLYDYINNVYRGCYVIQVIDFNDNRDNTLLYEHIGRYEAGDVELMTDIFCEQL